MQWHENLIKKYKKNFEKYIWLMMKKYNSDKYSDVYFLKCIYRNEFNSH